MGAMFNMKSSSPKIDGRLAASAKSVQLSVLLGAQINVPSRSGSLRGDADISIKSRTVGGRFFCYAKKIGLQMLN